MTCVRVRLDVSEWFPVNVGFRQGCACDIFVVVYCVYMDVVVREVNARVLWERAEMAV